jgi:hypothetical protein
MTNIKLYHDFDNSTFIPANPMEAASIFIEVLIA